MFSDLYDLMMKNPKISQIFGLILFVIILIGASTAISCHNCVNDPNQDKDKCKSGNFGNTINIIILVISILMILYHSYSLYVLFDGKSAFDAASNIVSNQISKRSGPVPTVKQVENAFSAAFGKKLY